MAVINRKQIEKLIYDTYSALDPTGSNTIKYKNIFSTMNDKEFEKFFKEFLDNENENFILDIVEYEHPLKFEYCEDAAKVIDIPLMEYVYMPHLTMDKKNVIVSKEKCLVGYFNVKRTQQLVHKKNRLSISDENRSSLTYQVTRNDKNSRDSDIEAEMLVALGAEHILQELHGPRADDAAMRRQSRRDIATKGFFLLEELDNSRLNKVTLNTVNVYMLSMGLLTDLITDSYILPKTSNELFN